MTSLTDFEAMTLTGDRLALSEFAGRVALVVNTASKCGFTPQYLALEDLWQRRQHQGFVILGFPCNQFGRQEPGTNEEIARFCVTDYDVTFPMFGKVDVNGRHAAPLWQWLRSSSRGWFGDRVKWNFTKFLVGRDGQVIRRYAPTVRPETIEGDIVAALGTDTP